MCQTVCFSLVYLGFDDCPDIFNRPNVWLFACLVTNRQSVVESFFNSIQGNTGSVDCCTITLEDTWPIWVYLQDSRTNLFADHIRVHLSVDSLKFVLQSSVIPTPFLQPFWETYFFADCKVLDSGDSLIWCWWTTITSTMLSTWTSRLKLLFLIQNALIKSFLLYSLSAWYLYACFDPGFNVLSAGIRKLL